MSILFKQLEVISDFIASHLGFISLVCVTIMAICVRQLKKTGLWFELKSAFIGTVEDKFPFFAGAGMGIVTAILLKSFN